MAAAAAEDAPAAFVCPILYEVMRDPVTTVRCCPVYIIRNSRVFAGEF